MLSLHYNCTVQMGGYSLQKIAFMHLLAVNHKLLITIESFSVVENLMFRHVDQGLYILALISFKTVIITAAKESNPYAKLLC